MAVSGVPSVVTLTAVVVLVLEGPGLVIRSVNEGFRRRFPNREVEGMPAREVFTDPVYSPLFALYDEVFKTGRERRGRFRGGPFLVRPETDRGEVVGLVSVYLPAQPPPPGSHLPLESYPALDRLGQLAD